MERKIIRVDMSTLTDAVEDMPQKWALLGGRALTSAVVAAEVPPTCHPLGEYNKLVFAPGLLTGTHSANSGRLSAGAKSPLTGGFKESNAGGTAAVILAHMGIRALIIEGMPEEDKLYGVHVSRDGVTIREADINVESMENIIFQGVEGACANIQIDEKLSDRALKEIETAGSDIHSVVLNPII